MSLRLDDRIAEEIHASLRGAYPEEGCGVLLGADRGEDRTVTRAIPLDNVQDAARRTRYPLSPEQILAAEREARRTGVELIGFFHSHPDHPARPSAFDLEHAWPYYSYVIVSVAERQVVETTAWRLSADRSRFEPETIERAREGPAEATNATQGASRP